MGRGNRKKKKNQSYAYSDVFIPPSDADMNGVDEGEFISVSNKPTITQPIINKPIINKPIINKPIINKPIINKPKTIDKPLFVHNFVNKYWTLIGKYYYVDDILVYPDIDEEEFICDDY
jgi:hypothetical protein